jgi:hypothetical protein
MNNQRYVIKYVSGADTHNVIDLSDKSVVQTCGYEEALEAMNALQGAEDIRNYGYDRIHDAEKELNAALS